MYVFLLYISCDALLQLLRWILLEWPLSKYWAALKLHRLVWFILFPKGNTTLVYRSISVDPGPGSVTLGHVQQRNASGSNMQILCRNSFNGISFRENPNPFPSRSMKHYLQFIGHFLAFTTPFPEQWHNDEENRTNHHQAAYTQIHNIITTRHVLQITWSKMNLQSADQCIFAHFRGCSLIITRGILIIRNNIRDRNRQGTGQMCCQANGCIYF